VKIEVIFVTSDRDDKAFKEYFAEHGDWLSYKFGDAQIKKVCIVQFLLYCYKYINYI